MEDMMGYVLYMCLTIPMIFSLIMMRGTPRLIVLYMIFGTTICLVASEINGMIYNYAENMAGAYKTVFFCTNYSPVVEEILKALPVLFFAFFISDKMSTLVQISFATGLGFAIMENMVTLTQHQESASILWGFLRGIGASLMHGICTVAVGMGIAFVRKQKKLFVCGTLGLLAMAMVYHAFYNATIMSDYKYFGFLIPIVTFIPVNIYFAKNLKLQEESDP